VTHILIINQHGENRGDEAAMRAMLASFKEQLPDVSFTLLYQFRDRSLRLEFHEDVEDLPIFFPALDYLRGLFFSALKAIRIDARWILPLSLKRIISAYERADLVVSAPGGPYFGDLYVDHEIVHWWYVYLAKLFKKPLFLYATSAGPFNHRLMNLVRRWLYPKFDRLVTRESISATFIDDLLDGSVKVEVTADSAIQRSVEPLSRKDYFLGERNTLCNRFIVAVSLLDFGFPKSKDIKESKRNYNEAMIELITHIHREVDAHFLFIPQLYGKAHSDLPYLKTISNVLPTDISWEIVDSKLNSDMQQALFGMCDLYIASRYHPAIFGNISFVPGLCIYYEHKALGFMTELGLERYAFDINNVEGKTLCNAFNNILEKRDLIIAHLHNEVPKLREQSSHTTKLAIELLRPSGKSR
jgi:polysaccharide pyruvyl transferase WcaK-like protein